MALFGPKLIMNALSADDAVSDVMGPVEVGNVNELTLYVVFSSGVASGVIQFEEAHDKNYAGVWAAIGSAVNSADGAVKTVKATGVSAAVRARITTVIGGGTVSCWLMGR